MSLRTLSDQKILSRIHELTRDERSATLLVLLHLNEIARRKLHLKLGYASLFSYCTEALGYSSSAAARRIRTARCIARFPEVYALLEANEVNLTTIAMVSHLLTPGNQDELLGRIRGKSQREAKEIIAEYEPRASVPRDRMEPVVVRVAARLDSEPRLMLPPGAASTMPASHDACGDSGSQHEKNAAGQVDGTAAVVTETYTKISFAAGEVFMKKFRKIQSLAWHRLPANPSVEQVLELAMDGFLEKEDPKARRERREARKERTATGASVTKDERTSEQPPRYIAAAVRDEVFSRDAGRCAFVGLSGRRCSSTQALQMDHLVPVARGGRGTPDNLRLLCAYHNRMEAERLMGVVPMAQARERNRQLPLRQ